MRDNFVVHVDFKDDAWMPSNRTKYENLAILKTHSRRNLMHLVSRFHRDLHVPFSGGSKQIHYKGVNGVLETQEPCGAAR